MVINLRFPRALKAFISFWCCLGLATSCFSDEWNKSAEVKESDTLKRFAIAVTNKSADIPLEVGRFKCGEQFNAVVKLKFDDSRVRSELSGVETSCGCLKISEVESTEESDDTVLLHLLITANPKPIKFSQRATLTFNDDTQPLRLAVSGEIYTTVSVSPMELEFSENSERKKIVLSLNQAGSISSVVPMRGVLRRVGEGSPSGKLDNESKTLWLSSSLGLGSAVEILRVTYTNPSESERIVDIPIPVTSKQKFKVIPSAIPKTGLSDGVHFTIVHFGDISSEDCKSAKFLVLCDDQEKECLPIESNCRALSKRVIRGFLQVDETDCDPSIVRIKISDEVFSIPLQR